MKRSVWFYLLLFVTLINAEPVRNLKAFDMFTGNELTAAWQNQSPKVRFTWKEPLLEVRSYKYALGPTGKEPLQMITETNECTMVFPGEGTFIFRVAPVDAQGKTWEEKKLILNYDKTPPSTEVSATLNQMIIRFTTGKTEDKGAPLKGILFYYGPNPNGQPDKFCTVTADIRPLLPRQGDPDYYIKVALEDQAGNVSAVQTIATVNTAEPALIPGSPNMRILGRTSEILNEKKELIPGAKIRYTLSIINEGTSAAPHVELTDVIPQGTTLVANSAQASRAVRIEYLDTSLNRGKGAWTVAPDRNQVKKIRWVFTEPFQPSTTPDSVVFVVEANKI